MNRRSDGMIDGFIRQYKGDSGHRRVERLLKKNIVTRVHLVFRVANFHNPLRKSDNNRKWSTKNWTHLDACACDGGTSKRYLPMQDGWTYDRDIRGILANTQQLKVTLEKFECGGSRQYGFLFDILFLLSFYVQAVIAISKSGFSSRFSIATEWSRTSAH